MKTYIIYNSKTGFTKRYADWIAEELGLGAQPYKGFDIKALNGDDTVVFCGRIMAGKIDCLKDLKKLLSEKQVNSLILAAVGATPAASEAAINTIWANNLTADEMDKIPHFYLEGGIDYEKMGFGERTILKAAIKFLTNKKDKTSVEAELERVMGSSFDNTSRDNLAPLLGLVRNQG